MKRRIEKVILNVMAVCVVMACNVVGVHGEAPEIATMPSEQEIITTVGILGIMNGDYNGDLHLDDYVTRAEFTKIALCTSALGDNVSSAGKTAPFSDVLPSHWASGYIITAVSNNYLRGYIDGTFRPDRQVTLEEAVTVMLRILGYSELDSGKYPDSQLSKYEELNLDNGINATQGQALTRRQCMYLAYNVLCTETKNGSVQCQALGYSTDSNNRIDYHALVGKNMNGPVTVDAEGKYAERTGIEFAKARFFRDGKNAEASDLKLYDQVYYNRDIRTIWAYSDKTMGLVDSVSVAGVTFNSPDYEGKAAISAIGSVSATTSSASAQGSGNFGSGAGVNASSNVSSQASTTVHSVTNGTNSIIVNGTSYTLGNEDVIRKFASGGSLKCDDFVMLMLDKDGNVGDAVIADRNMFDTYITDREDKTAIMDSSLKGPYTAVDVRNLKVPFDTDNASVYLNGKSATMSDMKKYDIYYYSVPFSSVWIYRNSESGIVDAVNAGGIVAKSDNYDGMTPSYSNAVVVGGSTYALGNDDVAYKFSAYGSIFVDDFVLLLFDKNGNVADAVCPDNITDYIDEDQDTVSLINSTLKGPFVLKSGETLGEKIPFDLPKADVFLNSKKVTADSARVHDVYYYSEPFSSVWIYRDTASGFVTSVSPSSEAPTMVTLGTKAYNLEGASIKHQFSVFGTFGEEDFVTLHLGKGGTAVYATEGDIYEYINNNDDGVTFADLAVQSMKGPVVVKPNSDWESKIPVDISQASFYRKNSPAAKSDIKNYDVLYYSKTLSSVWIYSDKATGVFESALPNRISPSSVVVSGKTYSLEGTGASYALSNLGTFKYGDTVTLLLGKDGGVVDVISETDNAKPVYGFITAFGEGTYTRPNGTTYTAENITIMATDTAVYTYEYEDDYFNKGDFVCVTLVDGKIKITKSESGVSASEATNINNLISKGSFAQDAVILDVYVTTDADSLENRTVEYKAIYPSRLVGAKLSTNNIYHAKTEDGVITELILRDFTGDIHSYGVLVAERGEKGLDYSMVTPDGKTAITLNTAYGTPVMGAARFMSRGGKYTVTNLGFVNVEGKDFQRAYCISGGTTYNYASDVQFYKKTGVREFTPTTYDDIAEGKYKISAYYDDTAEKGGRIRVVIAE